MIQIAGEETISLYMNFFALMLVMAPIFLSHRLISARTSADKLFRYLCVASVINSVSGIIYSVSKEMQASWSSAVILLCVTVGRIAVLTLLFLWILYVDYRLNRSRDHLIRRYPVLLVPIGIIVILFVINLFTGILFKVYENMTVHQTVLYHIIFGINIVFFLISSGVFFRYKKSVGSLAFFSIAPFLVPVAVGAAGEFVCFYASETAGFAIGLVFMYFSMLACWKYEDTDPAFYNPSYLDYVCDCLKNGSSPVKSAVLFSADDTDALAAILKDNLPKRHETVHLADDRYLYLSVRTNPNYLDGLTGMIRYAADAFGCGTDDTPVNLQTEYLFPDKDETDPADWLSGLKLVEGT
jgi:hypothetical protein